MRLAWIPVFLAMLGGTVSVRAGDREVEAGRGGVLVGLDRDLRALAAKAGPAVVRVSAERELNFGSLLPPAARGQFKAKAESLGSGFLVSDDGLIVTSSQVVEGAETARVQFPDGKRFEARVLGADDFFRVAVLRAEGVTGVTAIDLEDAEPTGLGAIGVCFGNSSGASPNLSLVIVNGTGVSFDEYGYDNYVTLSVPLQPGDVGGPVLDARGRVIGMSVGGPPAQGGGVITIGGAGGLFRGSVGMAGTGCAVPTADLRYAVREIEAHGRVRHGRLGVLMKPDSLEVREVVGDMPAADAGIQVGDRILALGGREIDSGSALRFTLRRFRVGTNVRIRLSRGETTVDATVKLEEHLGAFGVVFRRRGDGLEVLGMTPDWENAGLATGDVIVAIGDRRIAETEDWVRLLHVDPGGPIRLEVRRGGKTVEVVADR